MPEDTGVSLGEPREEKAGLGGKQLAQVISYFVITATELGLRVLSGRSLEVEMLA